MEEIRKILCKIVPEIPDKIELNDDLKNLGFNSLEKMELVFCLEDEWETKIPDDLITPEYFSNINGLIKLKKFLLN